MTTKDDSYTREDPGIERVKRIRNPALVRERWTQLLDAALELFVEKGYHRTTIRDICARSGINRASFYDFVQNKDDILRRLLYRMHHPERPESNGEPYDPASLASFEAYLIYLFEFAWTENREVIQLTYRTAGDMARDDLGEVLSHDAALVDRVAKGSYCQKLVMRISGGAFDQLFSVLEFDASDGRFRGSHRQSPAAPCGPTHRRR